jgi:hypothetical protein
MDPKERKILQDRADALLDGWIFHGREEEIVQAVDSETPRRAAVLVAMMTTRLDLGRAHELVHILAGAPTRA